MIFLTMGKEGSRAYYKDLRVERKGYQVKAIETTGAGDTFCGCAIHGLLKYGLEGLTEESLGADPFLCQCRRGADHHEEGRHPLHAGTVRDRSAPGVMEKQVSSPVLPDPLTPEDGDKRRDPPWIWEKDSDIGRGDAVQLQEKQSSRGGIEGELSSIR